LLIRFGRPEFWAAFFLAALRSGKLRHPYETRAKVYHLVPPGLFFFAGFLPGTPSETGEKA
jgi:hypothetical protein